MGSYHISGVIFAKSCSQQQIKIGHMWTKWLINFVICYLSCAHGSICFVWWFILQTIPKEFKKSNGVLVSLEPRLLWPLTYIRPSLQQAGYLVQQRIVKYHGAKLLFDCRSYFLINFRLNYLLNMFIWFEITNLYLGVAVVITWICHWNKFNFYCVIVYF